MAIHAVIELTGVSQLEDFQKPNRAKLLLTNFHPFAEYVMLITAVLFRPCLLLHLDQMAQR